MAEKISINRSEFNSNVSNLQSSIRQVDTSISTDETFEATNLKPFTENLEVLIQLINQLEEYKVLFQEDIQILESVGASLQEQDERLASSHSTSSGYEPTYI